MSGAPSRSQASEVADAGAHAVDVPGGDLHEVPATIFGYVSTSESPNVGDAGTGPAAIIDAAPT